MGTSLNDDVKEVLKNRPAETHVHAPISAGDLVQSFGWVKGSRRPFAGIFLSTGG